MPVNHGTFCQLRYAHDKNAHDRLGISRLVPLCGVGIMGREVDFAQGALWGDAALPRADW